MKISPEGIAITKRFFKAIDKLKEDKLIRGLKTFTTEFGINYWNINTVKNQPERSVLKPEWIYYIVKEYKVSSEWIITGRGRFYTKKQECCTYVAPKNDET